MQWPYTYLLAFAFSGLCGFWFYVTTFKGWRWKKAITKVGYSSSAGMALAMVLCWKWFDAVNDAEAVIGLCGIGGLLGYNVETLKRYIRIVLLAALRNGHNGSHHHESGSEDTPNPYLEERPSD